MHIPEVTDEMLEAVIKAAASPVVVVLHEGGPDRRELMRTLEPLADDFDDRFIFLAVNVDENPSVQSRWRGHGLTMPCVLTFRRGSPGGWSFGCDHREQLEKLWRRP